MTPQTLADVTPGGTATPLTADKNLQAVWVTISAPAANAADLRVGDSNVSSSRGCVIPKGTSFTFQRGDFGQQAYLLSAIYVYGTTTDKASITYGI